jgi:hypothetical protein
MRKSRRDKAASEMGRSENKLGGGMGGLDDPSFIYF